MRSRSPFQPSPDRWYGLGLICFTDGTWGHTGTLESAHAMVLHRNDGITWSILVAGDTPKDTDDLRGMFDDVIARPACCRSSGADVPERRRQRP